MKKFFSNIIEWVAAVMVVALAVIVFLQVFNRFVLKAPFRTSRSIKVRVVRACQLLFCSRRSTMTVAATGAHSQTTFMISHSAAEILKRVFIT